MCSGDGEVPGNPVALLKEALSALSAADPQQLADAALGEGIVALGTVG